MTKFFKTEEALGIWDRSYCYRPEAPLGTFERIAKELATNELRTNPTIDPDSYSVVYNRFLNCLIRQNEDGTYGLKNTPGGRITANIGTAFSKATLINCFVTGPVKGATITYERKVPNTNIRIPIKYETPENPDNLMNIFLTILEQAKTLASEGGYGINFDFIRPRGSIIKGIGIEHPGIVQYMKIWDQVARCIVSGNNDGYVDTLTNYLSDEEKHKLFDEFKKVMARKGAMMGCLSISHPDIEEFVKAKQLSGNLTLFNMSVTVPDEFMEALINDEMWDLTFEDVVYKRVKAKDLWNLIMQSTYNRAEPGIIFVDNAMKKNPIAYLGKVNATNPCGEVPGNPETTTTCLLGSCNLTQYVNMDRTFDWDLYKKDIATFTRMLDNVNDISKVEMPTYLWAIENLRQIGVGINGFGSALIMLGIAYDSEEAAVFAKDLWEIKENITWQESAKMAVEKGVFPAYDAEKFQSTEFYNDGTLWPETKEMIEEFGVRNAKTTMNAPLGSTSMLCDYVSNGLEPIFSLETERKVTVVQWPEGLSVDNVKSLLPQSKEGDATIWRGSYNGGLYYYEPHNRGLCEIKYLRDYGYQWLIENFGAEEAKNPEYIRTTRDLGVDDHVVIQAIAQKYTNQAISKTINLPNDYSFEDFSNVYVNSWKKGLIGTTTYREGSMESVLATVEENKPDEPREIIVMDLKLPDEFINGPTQKIRREGNKYYIHMSYHPEDSEMKFPMAIWIKTNNTKGETVACNRASKALIKLAIDSGIDAELVAQAAVKSKDVVPHDKLARMISLNMRHNVSLVDILECISNIEGDHISSLLTAVRKFISSKIPDGTMSKKAKCVQCGSDNMKFESGCSMCVDCGYSGCA